MAYNTHIDHEGSVDADPTAWPSSYYGRTKRIDLAKVYSDTLLKVNQAQEQKEQRKQQKARRQVSFTTAPPVIYEYEQEDINDYSPSQRRRDHVGQLRIQTLDLRPIPNSLYNHSPQPITSSASSPTSSSQVDDDDHSSVDDDLLLYKTNSRSRSPLAALFSLRFYSHYRKKQQCCK